MKNISLYIHIPFCLRKCLFCSFAIAVGQDHRKDDYIQALIQEMKMYKGTFISSIYLGGGTPSSLMSGQLLLLLKEVRAHFTMADNCEITMEANPEDISVERLQSIKQAGINRLSIGVQSLDDRYLKFLGRVHDSRRAKEAFELASKAGLTNISGDLMYGFPGQSKEELISDMDQMINLGCTHISIYTLTIEPNSRFYVQAMKLDDEDKLADHYQTIIDHLAKHGYGQYEVSNFAKRGYESKHNSHYWQGEEYIGLGMGAHGYWKGNRYWNHDRLNVYLEAIQHHQPVMAGQETLSDETKLKEKLIFGLRMNQGIEESKIFQEAAPMLKESLTVQLNQLIEGGFLVREGGYLKVTDKGRMVLDDIAIKLV
jgi:putative oxygen-independent coproporphyrinogen III oxidase